MAGESPDRSEQGKSSGETARREDGRERGRDPRLALGGPSSAEEGPADGELTEGAADGALAAETDREAAGESAEDSEHDSGPDSGVGSPTDHGDARLRAAVAAWVASADANDEGAGDESAGDGDGDGTDGADGADGAVTGETSDDRPEGAAADGQPEGDRDGSARSDLPRRSVDRPTASLSALPRRPEKADVGESADGADSEAARDGAGDEAARDGAGDEAVDRPTSVFRTQRPAKRAEASVAGRSTDGEAAAADGEPAESEAARSAPQSGGETMARAERSESRNGATGGGDATTGEGGTAGKDEATTGDGGAAAESPAGSAGPATARGPVDRTTSVFRALSPPERDKASDVDGAAEHSEQAADVPERPVDQPTAVFKAPRLQERDKASETPHSAREGRSAAENAPSAEDDGSVKSSNRQPSRGEKSKMSEKSREVDRVARDDDRPAGSASAGPVDQASTAFKAVRPTSGDSDSGGNGGGAGSGGADAPGGSGADGPAASASERTSRFVPLKSADDAPRKPRSAVSTTEPAEPAEPAEPEAGAASEAKAATASEAKGTTASEAKAASASEAKAAAASEAKGATASDAPAPPSPPGSAPAKPSAPPRAAEPPALPESERTKQEPVPDPAPLELLAQLTNTPPPPETPLRNVVRRIKIWTPLVVLLAIVFAIAQAVRPLPEPTLALTASNVYEFDGAKPSMPWPKSGQAAVGVDGLGSFGTFGEQKPVPIASVAKTMTAYVILKEHPLKPGSQGARIPVDRKAEEDAGLGAQNESVVETEEGEKLTEYEALNAIMIASANNVARLLARWDAGSEKAFVKKMNHAAKDLGMKNTNYTDPSGLEATTVSTAEDQVKLGRKVMQDPVFREVVAKPSYKDRNGKKQDNWNRLVPFHGVGIKTGTSTAAQGNLLFAAQKKVRGTTQLIIGAVLRQPPDASDNSILTGAVEASKPLIDAAGGALTTRKVVKKGDVVGHVDDGLGGTTPVVATRDVSAVGWTGLTVDIALTDNGKVVPHEAKAGAKVGTMTVGSGLGQVKVPIALQKDLVEPGFGDKLARIT
ncbi:D-alanyl-D-alanine carboxypeptidase [Streptomyces sp. NPDC051776]|uniref:D-alanyl-D-alanine carboxypeptidase n=1 Tax=Streptomyces sp. NPDC051776 TaxID=3155414 RepID=UPI00343C9068